MHAHTLKAKLQVNLFVVNKNHIKMIEYHKPYIVQGQYRGRGIRRGSLAHLGSPTHIGRYLVVLLVREYTDNSAVFNLKFGGTGNVLKGSNYPNTSSCICYCGRNHPIHLNSYGMVFRNHTLLVPRVCLVKGPECKT